MTLVFLGIVLLILGFNAAKISYRFEQFRGGLLFGGVVLIGLGLALSTVVQIGAGEVGVQTLFGKVQPRILTSGLNVVNPLVEVTEFDTRTQNYTMSAQHNEGQQAGDDAIRVLSADGLEVVIDLTVLYRVVPTETPKVLSTIGEAYQDAIVRPVTRTRIRDNAVYYDAVALYSTKRDEFQARIFKSISDDFKSRGLLLEQLLIRNIQLPQSVKRSIESKISAEQDAQKMQFVVQKERQEAERKRVEAQGIADYQKIINQEITDKLLQYESIKANKEIATSPNSKVIIMGSRGTAPQVLIGDK
ncbi:Regulator of protease activity HflC, stomatin/prohibitin superfamily [Hymenobacter daecheongensis DSM 21074]|uniref:Regulator of protease activity HflC, stomatin/prohibitin superfamily n=1 Tax=Hymenobacter daecheongensis DSM 21074 TaxID=1121955 RepID=A0A1M6C9H0_9BACT|nr:prohibitin family protein [Hymenobacter daecheongensis]SHI57659.1 Regulator of protease activity HflC, stomatin/prohibitin superfamily [Hymenobacter daecheongensis DSM 21074]